MRGGGRGRAGEVVARYERVSPDAMLPTYELQPTPLLLASAFATRFHHICTPLPPSQLRLPAPPLPLQRRSRSPSVLRRGLTIRRLRLQAHRVAQLARIRLLRDLLQTFLPLPLSLSLALPLPLPFPLPLPLSLPLPVGRFVRPVALGGLGGRGFGFQGDGVAELGRVALGCFGEGFVLGFCG